MPVVKILIIVGSLLSAEMYCEAKLCTFEKVSFLWSMVFARCQNKLLHTMFLQIYQIIGFSSRDNEKRKLLDVESRQGRKPHLVMITTLRILDKLSDLPVNYDDKISWRYVCNQVVWSVFEQRTDLLIFQQARVLGQVFYVKISRVFLSDLTSYNSTVDV